MTRRRAPASLLAGVGLAAFCTAPPGPAEAAAGPLANPPANRPLPLLARSTGICQYSPGDVMNCPSPCFPKGTFGYNASQPCTQLLLTAINQGQAAEHLPGFALPSNYFALSAAGQLFVLVNLERISRGVPPLVGLSPYLDAETAAAADQGRDPNFHPSYGPVQVWVPPDGGYYAVGGAWAGNSVNAASALFGWFYDDGWGGPGATWNFACTSPTASGCWGHRDQLLGKWAGTTCTDCVAGASYSSSAAGWKESYDFLLVRPVKFPTPLVFTWDSGVLPYLPAGWESVRAP